MAMDACCNPTVPWAMTMIGFPSILAYPCAIATEDSSWVQVSHWDFLLRDKWMTASCGPRTGGPGFGAIYPPRSDLKPPPMKPDRGGWVVSPPPRGGGGVVPAATRPADGNCAV